MNLLTVTNLAKNYGEKQLFKDISFTITDTDKIGLIGINGTGKSTFLKILANKEFPDSGEILIPKGIKVEYLPQNPDFDTNATILEQIFKTDTPLIQLIRTYENTLNDFNKNPHSEELQDKIQSLTLQMDKLNAWDTETQIKTILTKLGIYDFEQRMESLSGGQKKRVALASALITPSDLLILDEPTNHLDNEAIEWLEKFLTNKKMALFMVTHDRYFLDRVVTKTLELDNSKIYVYDGNYSRFLEKKVERKTLEKTLEMKRQQLYKKELEWIRAGARARSTKQKARIDRFEQLEQSAPNISDEKISISVGTTRLGKKIIEINNMSKAFPNLNIIDKFSYIITKNDRIGIVGSNGIGKSTLLNLITQQINPDKGSIEIGTTVRFGYFTQENMSLDDNMKAIDYLKESAEFVTTADGMSISISQMMERFLFPPHLQWTYIAKLSGGEKRRLFLLKILIEQPNVLILDEPTNDLDIDTLKVLEDYIDSFQGSVITVSHDRYFLDRICNKIFSFSGNGIVKVYTGNYSDYLEKITGETQFTSTKSKEKNKTLDSLPSKTEKVKLTYKEKLEYDKIYTEIDLLEEQLQSIEKEMEMEASNYGKLQELVELKNKIEDELLIKMEREEYLSHYA